MLCVTILRSFYIYLDPFFVRQFSKDENLRAEILRQKKKHFPIVDVRFRLFFFFNNFADGIMARTFYDGEIFFYDCKMWVVRSQRNKKKRKSITFEFTGNKKNGRKAKRRKSFSGKFLFYSSHRRRQRRRLFLACFSRHVRIKSENLRNFPLKRLCAVHSLLHRRRDFKKKKISVLERFIFGKNEIALLEIFRYRLLVARSPSSILWRWWRVTLKLVVNVWLMAGYHPVCLARIDNNDDIREFISKAHSLVHSPARSLLFVTLSAF